ncbi:MAG TPA: hypothetical protein VKP66_18480 [Steroidobacteraceae bacterium]|nr:hypothetical protein [Steroidobacteraceae bacterium]
MRRMKRGYVPLAGLLAALLGSSAFAQAPAPGAQPSDPSAASSPSQRSAVKSPAGETAPTNGANVSDTATPHQKQVLKKKHGKKKKAAPAPSSQP